MNKYQLYGTFLVIIGLILLFGGLAIGFASDTGYYFLIGAFTAIAIGFSALYIFRGINKYSPKTPTLEKSVTDDMKPTPIAASTQTNKMPEIENAQINKPVSVPSKIVCGSCTTLNDMDAVFCKKCGNRFR